MIIFLLIISSVNAKPEIIESDFDDFEYQEQEEFFDPADDKIYRHPTFYDIPVEVGHM